MVKAVMNQLDVATYVRHHSITGCLKDGLVLVFESSGAAENKAGIL